jgi:3-mercaptopyruvate sulfurtransferase SseA
VAARREGKFVYYPPGRRRWVAALHRIAERSVAEVGRVLESYFRDRDSLEPVSREELLQRSRAGTVTVLDVRPEDEFALGHSPGAVNVPLRALEAE